MAIRKIVTLEDELLRKKSREVTEINERIITLLDDMQDTLAKAEGVGLAAPQVGILRRIFIINQGIEEDKLDFIEFINPRIVKMGKKQVEMMEGCLSVPGKSANVTRPETVVVEATDREGNLFEYKASGLMARCVYHEYDHLDGILYIDKVDEILEDED